VRVGYLGPEGTYTEEALLASAPAGVERVPFQTVHETVMAVETGAVERAVVPIENALEGSVSATGVWIAGEVVHPIHHCVVAARDLPLEDVTRVLSHPQATAQCDRFLRERLPGAERVTTSSTAEAVRSVAADGGTSVALASRLAAELYGCVVLAADVEDHPDNATRFVWLTPAGVEPAPGPDAKTSVVFWGAGDESPGWLVAVLGELADRGVNLTKIESRPRRVRLGHYMFFVDVDGAATDPPVAEALEAVGQRVETLRVLGSYARGGGYTDPHRGAPRAHEPDHRGG
jgi:prephenate dehydratase